MTESRLPLPPKDFSRIPSLDGIRAIAISIVIAAHTVGRYGWPPPGSTTHRWLVGESSGFWPDGVGIFFVLSGFLITTLLLREHERTGEISLKQFYLRRCFRILPPLYSYVFFVFLFCLIVRLAVPWLALLSGALFFRDYAVGANFWATDHLWSLAVEEQFYILWPAALVWGLKSGGKRRVAKIAIACIILAPVLRVGGKLAQIRYFEHRVPMMFHNRMDALMCGCLLAILVGEPKFERLFTKISRFWWFFLAYTFVFSHALIVLFGIHYNLSIGLTIDAISISILMLWLIRNPRSLLGRALNSKLLTTMGALSYSAYLWQTFFISPENPTVLARMPYALVLIWVAAWLSYRLIELPALRLRDRIAHRRRKTVAAQSKLGWQCAGSLSQEGQLGRTSINIADACASTVSEESRS